MSRNTRRDKKHGENDKMSKITINEKGMLVRKNRRIFCILSQNSKTWGRNGFSRVGCAQMVMHQPYAEKKNIYIYICIYAYML